MKTCWKILSYVMTVLLTAAITLSICLITFGPNSKGANKLVQLETLIGECFIGEVDVTEMEDAAAIAMVECLDRWSYYIPADEYQAYQEQMANAYVGVGITIQLDEESEGFRIKEVTQNGPADQAGILVDDILIGAAGRDIRGMDTEGVAALVKGEQNTKVELTILRGGAEKTFSVTRKKVTVTVATGIMLDDCIGLVTIENFDDRCAKETIAVIDSLLEQGATALVFDVRNNPGGYANEMVEILDYLLPKGELFRTVDYRGKEDVEMSDAKCLDIPMAVLVNGNSYSAAEFFAAALNDYDAAVIVGEQTSGKGHFQNTFKLSDGSAVSLSVGKYFTPGGVSLEGVGITPEVPVVVDDETAARIYYNQLPPAEDPQIQAAIAALKGQNNG